MQPRPIAITLVCPVTESRSIFEEVESIRSAVLLQDEICCQPASLLACLSATYFYTPVADWLFRLLTCRDFKYAKDTLLVFPRQRTIQAQRSWGWWWINYFRGFLPLPSSGFQQSSSNAAPGVLISSQCGRDDSTRNRLLILQLI